tara:strand:- start:326 stop:1204 length:879 start_codon:yes stop_codon:yes gene_type:complete
MRIRFENFWGGFPVYDNIITVALKMRHNVEVVSGAADIVVNQGPRSHKDDNAITISWFIESMNRIGEPDYNNCDYSFNSCNLDDDRNYRIPFWATQINWNSAPVHDINRGPTYYVSAGKLDWREMTRRDRWCCSVASGTLGKRAEFYPLISEKMAVIHGGDFLRNTKEMLKKPGNSDYLEKIEFLSKFKSNLCFENDDRDGYVCEKILHAFYAGCLPIYWGPKNVGEDFNKKAFIDIRDFESDEEAIRHIRDVLSDDSKLHEYLKQPVFSDGVIPYHATPQSLSDFFEKIGV